MELRKKNLHMMQKKSEAQNQITFDEDYMYRIKKRISVRSSRRKARWRLNRSR